MTPRTAALVLAPSLAILAIAALVGEWRSGAVAVALTAPLALLSAGWMLRQTDARRAAIGWMAWTLLRMIVATAGSVLVFVVAEWTAAAGLMYWLWIAVAYLSTLAAEVFVLAKPGWVGVGGRKG
jgi:hypothetical protein